MICAGEVYDVAWAWRLGVGVKADRAALVHQ